MLNAPPLALPALPAFQNLLFVCLDISMFYFYMVYHFKNLTNPIKKTTTILITSKRSQICQTQHKQYKQTLSMTIWNVMGTHCSQHCGRKGCIYYKLLLGSLWQWFRDMFVDV